ncbi:MAG: flippase-like domain-containing protein [Candidatus Aminicenantes bacterium]|nr:flippase-like domain-containing protein [Candidatus Aminicenantes bacterium]
MPRKRILYVLVSLAVAALFLWLLLREIEPGLIKRTFFDLHLPALAAFVVIHLLAVWLRSWRYKILLHPLPCSWSGILLTTLVRNSFDDLLPARIGSLSYIYILNQRLGFSFESAASSFVVALVLDFLTLGPFVLLAILAVGARALPFSGSVLAGFALALFLLSALVLWKMAALTELIKKGFASFFRRFHLSGKTGARTVLEKLDLVRDNLDRVRSPSLMALLLVQSFFIRLAKYASVYFLLCGFLRSHGIRPGDVGFWKTILGLTGAEFTSILPVKGLGGFGTWEAAWTVTFRLLGFPADLAVVSGLGVHITTNLLEYGLGLGAILILLLPYVKHKRHEGRKRSNG